MKSKTLLLALLFLLLQTQMSFAEKKAESKPTLDSEYEIDLTRNYTGSEVLELIVIVEQEAENAIEKAFDEGYKQGVIFYVPEVEYWKTKSTHLENEISSLKKDRWTFAFGSFGAGLLLGGGFGLFIRIQN
ncbi:hypothetical protein [Treponema pectinovorum]|uniref:hypothetical protein n=1 Tax=Treponema pectinovorum TaxID=164 RepID=UPI0011C9CFED|nr:hypothetical protein [Treponema pectinovorum]